MAFPLALGAPILGGLQVLGGLLTKKGPRPEWQIPAAATEALGNARTMASASVRPGDQMAKDAISKNTAAIIGNINRTAGSATQALGAGEKAQINANNALNQNAAQNTQYQFNAKQNLQNVLGTYANLQREQQQKNVFDPYQARVDTKNALIGSGLQNIFGGLNNIGQQQMQQQFMESVYGKK